MQERNENITFSRANFELLIIENRKKAEENNDLKTRLEQAEKKIDSLIEAIKLGRQRQFDKKSETHKVLEGLYGKQTELSFDDTELPVDATEEPAPETETITYDRRKTKTVGRNIDTSKLPREKVIHDLSDAEKTCATCGHELEKIGEDVSEQLEIIPATLKVIENIRPKYTCRCCETIKAAAKPESPIPKSMAGVSLIAEVLIKKFEHHIPWYRQAKIFAQEGCDIPANTIGNWFMQAGEVLEPLKAALWKQLDAIDVLQADETPVKVLAENIKGYMWCYHSCVPNNRFVAFEYNDSRSGEVVNNTLENYKGILQSDGYSGYNKIRCKDKVINIGCWAHCRRKFVDVAKLATKTGKAHEIIKLIAELYKIEEEARSNNLSFAARRDLRQKNAVPILQKIYSSLEKITSPPKSALHKALTYAVNQKEYLLRYVDYGEAEIDNNWAENQIRPFALGRKNWLFLGNKVAANTSAFFYGIIQTCRLNNIDARKYLIYVLKQAGKLRRGEVDPIALLPQFIDKNLLV